MMFQCVAFLLFCGVAFAQPRFEAASVKAVGDAAHAGPRFRETPGRIHYTAASLREIIMRAYQRKDYQLETPAWMDAKGYDIDATYSAENEPHLQEMLRALLTERFKLQTHTIEKPTKVLALRVRPDGSSILTPAADPGKGGVAFAPEKIRAILTTMDNFSDGLSRILRIPVVDETGLTGRYTFELNVQSSPSPSGDYDSSAIIASLREIGLTVASTTVTGHYLLVDSANHIPSPN